MIPQKPVKTPSGRTHNICTPLQKLAQKENFALFQLKGMISQLNHLKSVPSINARDINELRFKLGIIRNQITSAQEFRKRAKIVMSWNPKDKENLNG